MEGRVTGVSRHVFLCLGVILAAAVLGLSLPAAARAGYITSQFQAPAAPNPDWQSQFDPHVSGGNVAYRLDSLDDTAGAYIWTIGEPSAVAWTQFAGGEYDYARWPAKDVVVYAHRDYDTFATTIWVTDGVTSAQISEPGPTASHPRIQGAVAVWQQGGDIKAVELDPSTLLPSRRWDVCSARGVQSHPDVDAGVVVWQDRRKGDWDIYARDLYHGAEKCICGARSRQTDPAVGGGWVVWVDRRGADDDIYGRPAAWVAAPNVWRLGRTLAVCTAPGAQREPVAGGGYVAWTDGRFSTRLNDHGVPDWDIRAYRLSARKAFRVTSESGTETSPSLDGDTLAWASLQDEHMIGPYFGRIMGVTLAP